MNIQYYKEYSQYLNRDMEFKTYGHGGRLCLVFPCSSGRFFDWENRGMCELASGWINAGKLTLVCVDSIDAESWDGQGDYHHRMEMQERWFNYICEEVMPRLHQLFPDSFYQRPLAAGSSMGAFHAVNFYLRRPDLFGGTVALSGLYDSGHFFGDYCDDILYRNTPNRYMANFPAGHPYYDLFNSTDDFYVCVGQGSWEDETLPSTLTLKKILEEHGIPAHVDVWGTDVVHDWNWWEKQWVYFLTKILG